MCFFELTVCLFREGTPKEHPPFWGVGVPKKQILDAPNEHSTLSFLLGRLGPGAEGEEPQSKMSELRQCRRRSVFRPRARRARGSLFLHLEVGGEEPVLERANKSGG